MVKILMAILFLAPTFAVAQSPEFSILESCASEYAERALRDMPNTNIRTRQQLDGSPFVSLILIEVRRACVDQMALATKLTPSQMTESMLAGIEKAIQAAFPK